jgi:hypothetical protein
MIRISSERAEMPLIVRPADDLIVLETVSRPHHHPQRCIHGVDEAIWRCLNHRQTGSAFVRFDRSDIELRCRLNGQYGKGVHYVVDERSPKPIEGQEWIVRSDDLIGEFDVKDGEIVPGSYRRNPDFALVNEEGLSSLRTKSRKT